MFLNFSYISYSISCMHIYLQLSNIIFQNATLFIDSAGNY